MMVKPRKVRKKPVLSGKPPPQLMGVEIVKKGSRVRTVVVKRLATANKTYSNGGNGMQKPVRVPSPISAVLLAPPRMSGQTETQEKMSRTVSKWVRLSDALLVAYLERFVAGQNSTDTTCFNCSDCGLVETASKDHQCQWSLISEAEVRNICLTHIHILIHIVYNNIIPICILYNMYKNRSLS